MSEEYIQIHPMIQFMVSLYSYTQEHEHEGLDAGGSSWNVMQYADKMREILP